MRCFTFPRKISGFIFRFLFVALIFIILAILCKSNLTYKDYIYEHIYEKNINFSYFKNIYNKYLGGVFPSINFNSTVSVFNEKLVYNELSNYYDGIKLSVSDNYLIPLLDDGIVVYIGDKDVYGSVILVEDDSGVDTWYGNICNVSVNLYDNLEAGSYIGQSCDDYIYLVYSKGNMFLDYNDYFG